MSEPFFPPPMNKESAPYRAAAEMPLVDVAPRVVHRPEEPASIAPKVAHREIEAGADTEPFLVRFALAATVGILWALVRAHELGEKWPQAVLIVLGVVGFLAAPVVLYFRVRRILRFLFARGDDA